MPEASIGEFPGFAFFGIDASLPVDGRWVIVVTGGTEAVTLPLLVDTWTPPAHARHLTDAQLACQLSAGSTVSVSS